MLSTPTRLRAFFLSFVLTVMLTALLCGFVAVDRSTENYGFQALSPVIALEAVSDGGLTLNWMGRTVRLPLEPLDRLEELRLRYHIPLPPSLVLGAECLALMRLGWTSFWDARLERMYVQSVQDEP
jgi:hypothetical protein